MSPPLLYSLTLTHNTLPIRLELGDLALREAISGPSVLSMAVDSVYNLRVPCSRLFRYFPVGGFFC